MSFDKYSDKAAEAIALIREFAKVEYWDFFKGDPEQALEAFCAMQDAAEEMGRMNNHRAWISVDERLPPAMRERMFSENVLVINMKSNYPNVQISELNYFENENVWRGCNVTHWMPLPKVPGAAPSQPQQEAVPAEPSEQDKLDAALKIARAGLEKISQWRFGWDGDCGVTKAAEDTIEAIDAAITSLIEQGKIS